MKIKELFEKTTNNDTETFQLLKQLQDKHGTSSYSLKDTVVLPDGSVNYNGQVFTVNDFMVDENGELKVKLRKCKMIRIATDALKSFNNFPNVLEGSKNGSTIALGAHPSFQNSEFLINSFGNMELDVLAGDVELGQCPKLSLSKINKHIKSLNGGLFIYENYKGPLLSVMKIHGLKYVEAQINKPSHELEQALDIINDHLQSDGNIIACQKELYDNNLDEYAEL